MWTKQPGEIAEGFFMIGTSSNPMYLLQDSNEWVLIEGGLLVNTDIVLAQLNTILQDISLLKHWFITHSHYDHCGSLESIRKYVPEIKIYASEEAIINLSSQKYLRKIQQLNHMISSSCLSWEEIPNSDFTPIKFIPLYEGHSTIDGLKNWKFIETPGHSKCSISLYHTTRKLLFTSDSLGEIITTKKWFPLAFESMSDFIESIHKLDRLDLDYVALGHHGVLSGVDAQHAASYALRSCYSMIDLANDILEYQGEEYLQEVIDEEFGVNDRSFIPPHVYTKSIIQLISVLKKERYLVQK